MNLCFTSSNWSITSSMNPKTFVRLKKFRSSCKCWILFSRFYLIYITLAKKVECSPVARKTKVQSQAKSYQRFKKWYLTLPYLTLSIIRCGSMVKGNNPMKGVVLSFTPRCSSYWKGSLWSHPWLRLLTLLFTLHIIFYASIFFWLNGPQLQPSHLRVGKGSMTSIALALWV